MWCTWSAKVKFMFYFLYNKIASFIIFLFQFAEFILREEPIDFLNTPEGVEELRKAIAVTLLQNSGMCNVQNRSKVGKNNNL